MESFRNIPVLFKLRAHFLPNQLFFLLRGSEITRRKVRASSAC